MDPTRLKTDCPICHINGPLLQEGSLQQRCFRRVWIREEERLKSVKKLIFEITSVESAIQARLPEPDTDSLGLVLTLLERPFFFDPLKKEIQKLPSHIIHEFLISRHKERKALFALLGRSNLIELAHFHKKNIPDRVTILRPRWHKSKWEKYAQRIHRFALFTFYFPTELYKLKPGRHYFDTSVPTPIDVHGDYVIHPLKRYRKGKYYSKELLGAGSEHSVRLALRINLKTKVMDICASAIPYFTHLNECMGQRDRIEWIERFSFNTSRLESLSNLTPHVVRPFHLMRYTKKSNESMITMVMEYGEETLEDKVSEGTCTLKDYIDLLKGLNAVHSHGFYSLDIKVEDILFVQGKIKYIDMGTAIADYEDPEEEVYTNAYRAFEMLGKEGPFTPGIDVFALGVVFYTMKYQTQPSFWDAFDENQSIIKMVLAFNQFYRNFRPEKDDTLGQVIRRMLHPKPRWRITAEEALNMLDVS